MINLDEVNYKHNLANNLNRLIGEKSCTQHEVAQALCIDDSAITKILRKKRNISVPELFKLSRYFDVSVEELVAQPKKKRIHLTMIFQKQKYLMRFALLLKNADLLTVRENNLRVLFFLCLMVHAN